MEKLQLGYQERRKVGELQDVGEMEVCRAMEREMREKKRKEMEDMKCVWDEERKQLHKITGN